MKLSSKTYEILADLENRIDPDIEDGYRKQWEDFLYGRNTDPIFTPRRSVVKPAGIVLPKININDAVGDYDLMLQSELVKASNALSSKGRVPGIRANYGTGIMTSLFGAEIFIMPYENNTLPTTRPLDDNEKIEAVVEKGIPSFDSGFGKNVFEFGELVNEVFENYPKIKKYVPMYHPDFQGPLDSCELLWGCEMFYAMMDEPELVHGLLELITNTYTEFMKKWEKMYPFDPVMNTHWNNFFYKGNILLRSDSAMNISPDTYREFSLPYDKRLLDTFGGGVVHFCGRGDHYIADICSLPNVYGINMSQPQYNDMEKIYSNTLDKGIKLLGFNTEVALRDQERAGGYNGSMHSDIKK